MVRPLSGLRPGISQFTAGMLPRNTPNVIQCHMGRPGRTGMAGACRDTGSVSVWTMSDSTVTGGVAIAAASCSRFRNRNT